MEQNDHDYILTYQEYIDYMYEVFSDEWCKENLGVDYAKT